MQSKEKAKARLDKEFSIYARKRLKQNSKIEFDPDITYNEFLDNKILIVLAIKNGIPYSLFDIIQSLTPFTSKDWSIFLDISTKSLQRYKASSDHFFKPTQSEKIIEITEVSKIGLEVFGDDDKLKLWLNTPNFALGNLKPIELLSDSYGKELIIKELHRINHGIFV